MDRLLQGFGNVGEQLLTQSRTLSLDVSQHFAQLATAGGQYNGQQEFTFAFLREPSTNDSDDAIDLSLPLTQRVRIMQLLLRWQTSLWVRQFPMPLTFTDVDQLLSAAAFAVSVGESTLPSCPSPHVTAVQCLTALVKSRSVLRQ